jgi:hypothetical protein
MLTIDIEKIPFFQNGIKQGLKKATFNNAIVMIKDFQLAI